MTDKYKSQYKVAELLLEFVNTGMSVDELLKKQNMLDSSAPTENLAINLNPKDLAHEYCHYVAWAKKGIRSSFHKNKYGDSYTVPNEEDFQKYLETAKPSKDDLIKLYLDVASAPLIWGISLGESDELYKLILIKRIKTVEEIDKFRKEREKLYDK